MGPKIAFRIGPISVAWYGIIIVLSALVAAYVAQFEAKRRGDDPEHVWNAFLWCLIFGIVGARIYHIFSSLDYYLRNPLQMLNMRAGGLGIIGAVLGERWGSGSIPGGPSCAFCIGPISPCPACCWPRPSAAGAIS